MLFALHLPNHTLTTELTWATGAVVAIAAAVGLFRIGKTLSRPSFAMFAVVTALVFGVQMVNFPLLDGRTSGHLLGAAAAVLLLGPSFGILALALVVAMQALLLGDGGMTAIGANVLNMAIVAPLTALCVAGLIRQRRSDAVGTIVAAAVAGWVSTVAAALACSAELAASGVGSFGDIATALVGQHALLGLVEAGFTAAVVAPVLLPATIGRRVQFTTLAIAATVAFALVPAASNLPDTLEVVLAGQAEVAAVVAR
jgi:cobalt/nickel transport system permease protein